MNLTADRLRKHHYRRYRLRRFGAAGRHGANGIMRAAEHHGVKVRVWMYYEAGKRRPKLRVRQAIARWLIRDARGPVVVEATLDSLFPVPLSPYTTNP